MNLAAYNLRDQLELAKKALPHLLRDRQTWYTKLASAEKPEIHRLWRPLDDIFTLHLHRLIRKDESLRFHAHLHPLIVEVISGEYTMNVKRAGDKDQLATHYLVPGSTYAITSQKYQHSIEPTTPNVWTIVVSGPLFDEKRTYNDARELTDGERDRVYNFFKKRFGEE